MEKILIPHPSSSLPPAQRSDDPGDRRLSGLVHCPRESNIDELLSDINENDVIVLGYADDRGVDRNLGRMGAAEGPDAIRKQLYNSTIPHANLEKLRIVDLGNLRSWSFGLEESQEIARDLLVKLRSTGATLITLGGGHDWAYPDFCDLVSSRENLHLINVDAHLDVRPNKGQHISSSGTPFRRLLSQKEASKQSTFKMSAIGLQKNCNALAHVEWALGHRIQCLFLEDFPLGEQEQWIRLVESLELNDNKKRFALSIDLDAFSAAYAPGVSAPSALGIAPQLIVKLVSETARRTQHLGIYELNPRFDRDNTTARLAAKLAFEFIQNRI